MKGILGGKGGFDTVCIDTNGDIISSGAYKKMLAFGRKKNCDVAKLVPVRRRRA